MIKFKPYFIAPVLALILLQGCGGGSFATQLRVILAASGPLIESLPLSESIKSGLITDFTDLGGGAADMAGEIKACADSRPCKLEAVSKFQSLFETVEARGHFGSHARLQTVQGIIKGLIASAKIYFGQRQTVARGAAPRIVTEDDLKAQIKELEAAIRP